MNVNVQIAVSAELEKKLQEIAKVNNETVEQTLTRLAGCLNTRKR